MDPIAIWVGSTAAASLLSWGVALLAERRAGHEIRAFTWLLAVLALVTLVAHHGAQVAGAVTGSRVHVWNEFHYYVGSKYFAELGYTGLYAATLSADDDFLAGGGDPRQGFASVKRSRDMRTYKLLPRAEIVDSFDRGSISEERLAELGRDTRWIRARTPDEKVLRMLGDLGLNPAPPWMLVGGTVANAIDLGGALFPLVTASDLAMLAVVVASMWWAFGLRAAALASIWLHIAPFNLGRTSGTFLAYDWLAASALAWACWHRGHGRAAGVALSWAAMTRVFPGLIALPVLVRTGWDLARGRRPERIRVAFSIAFCAACAALFVASGATGRGLRAWPEWAGKIALHSSTHATTGDERVGLGRLVLHQPEDGRFWRTRRGAATGDPAVGGIRLAATAAGLLLLLLALRRCSDAEAMASMLFAGWLLTTSSRYYASIWILLFGLPRRSAGHVPAGVALLLMLVTFHLPPSRNGRYLLLNYETGLMFACLCACLLLAGRRRSASGGLAPPEMPGPPAKEPYPVP